MSIKKREALRKGMVEGLKAPDFLKREFTQSDFPDLRRKSLKQWLTPDPEDLEGPPPTLVAVMNDIMKKILLGAVSWPDRGNLPIVLPTFPVIQKDKTRIVHNFSSQPNWNRKRKIFTNDDDYSFNATYKKDQKTCSFSGVEDKAAMCLVGKAGGAYDIKGYYDQLLAHPSLQKYQGMLIPIFNRRGEIIKLELILARTVMFGVAAAVSHATHMNTLCHEALTGQHPEVFTIRNAVSTEEAGLPTETEQNWKHLMLNNKRKRARFDTRQILNNRRPRNKMRWVHNEGEWNAKWQTSQTGQLLNNWTLHVDDAALITNDPVGDKDMIRRAVTLMREKKIMIAEEKIVQLATRLVAAGICIDFKEKTLSLPDDKWPVYEKRVLKIVNSEQTTLGLIAEAIGLLAHMSGLYPALKQSVSILGRQCSKIVQSYGGFPAYKNSGIWESMKKNIVNTSPRFRMIFKQAWLIAKNEPQVSALKILAYRARPDVVIACDASGNGSDGNTLAGLGAFELHKQRGFAFQVLTQKALKKRNARRWERKMHEHLAEMQIAALEGFTVICALHMLDPLPPHVNSNHNRPRIFYIMEDNSSVQPAITNLKAGDKLYPLTRMIQEWSDETGSVVQSGYENTKYILADPPSRFYKGRAKAEADFKTRFEILQRRGLIRDGPCPGIEHSCKEFQPRLAADLLEKWRAFTRDPILNLQLPWGPRVPQRDRYNNVRHRIDNQRVTSNEARNPRPRMILDPGRRRKIDINRSPPRPRPRWDNNGPTLRGVNAMPVGNPQQTPRPATGTRTKVRDMRV